jgi:hypothetical protein|tara:strand:- start:18 stop:227 length:210 start_codon:yes stop_codon:yes gene_type:complete
MNKEIRIIDIELEDKIEEINIFIKEFTKKKEVFDRGILGFSTDSYKYLRLIKFLNRLIDLEKEEFKRNT